MLGAIAGDIIGSVHEFRGDRPTKTTDFELFVPDSTFTDDSVLTVAIARCLLDGDTDYVSAFHRAFAAYPRCGWGGMFARWAASGRRDPYHSFGNGAAMRVSPVGFASDSLEETLRVARATAEVTHNHPEGIKGAQATAGAVFLARTGQGRAAIRDFVTGTFGYDLTRTLDEIRPDYRFDETCQGTVPQAITAFLEATSYEGAVRNAVSLGGDADTLAAIAGGIAHAFHGAVPATVAAQALARLDDRLRAVWRDFAARYGVS